MSQKQIMDIREWLLNQISNLNIEGLINHYTNQMLYGFDNS